MYVNSYLVQFLNNFYKLNLDKFGFCHRNTMLFSPLFFRYQTLATASDDAKQDNDTMTMSGKRIVADWLLVLGEYDGEIWCHSQKYHVNFSL